MLYRRLRAKVSEYAQVRGLLKTGIRLIDRIKGVYFG
jgi:hypothetical protein